MSQAGDTRWRGPGPLLLLLLLATALRIVGFDAEPLQFDEVASLALTRNERVLDTLHRIAGDVHPPLHFLVLHLIQRLGGGSTLWMRLPSLLLGVAALPGLYLLGRRLFGESEGRLAAALGAVSAPAIYYSQEARPYAMVMCFTVWAAWAWIPLLRLPSRADEPGWHERALWVLFALLSAYAHYFGLMVIGLQSGVLLLRFARRPRELLRAGATVSAVVLGYVPWLPALLASLGKEVFWIARPTGDAPRAFLEWQFNESPGLAGLAIGLIVLAAILGGVRWIRGPRPPVRALLLSPEILLAGGFLGPFLLAWVRSLVDVPVMTMRNLLVCLPPGLLLVARATTALPLRPRATALLGGAVLSAFMGDLLLVRQFYREPQRDAFRAAATSLAERLPSTPRPLLLTCGTGYALQEVLAEQGLDTHVQAARCSDQGWEAIARTLDKEQPEHLWILRNRIVPGSGFAEQLTQRMRLVDTRAWRGAALLLLDALDAADPDDALQHWWVRSPLAPGSWVHVEGAEVRVHLPRDGRPRFFEMCQALPVLPRDGLVVRGRIRRDLALPDQAVRLFALYDGDEVRPIAPLFTGEGGADWVEVHGRVQPRAGATGVRLCVRTVVPAVARKKGIRTDLWMEGLEIVQEEPVGSPTTPPVPNPGD